MAEHINSFAMMVLKSLNIDSNKVSGFTIVCRAGELPTIEIERHLLGPVDGLATELKKFKIEPIDQAATPGGVCTGCKLVDVTRIGDSARFVTCCSTDPGCRIRGRVVRESEIQIGSATQEDFDAFVPRAR